MLVHRYWFDRNQLQNDQVCTSRPRYMLFYRFEPNDWPSWKYADKKNFHRVKFSTPGGIDDSSLY